MKQADFWFLFQVNARNWLNTDCINARSRKLQNNRRLTKNKARSHSTAGIPVSSEKQKRYGATKTTKELFGFIGTDFNESRIHVLM